MLGADFMSTREANIALLSTIPENPLMKLIQNWKSQELVTSVVIIEILMMH